MKLLVSRHDPINVVLSKSYDQSLVFLFIIFVNFFIIFNLKYYHFLVILLQRRKIDGSKWIFLSFTINHYKLMYIST